LSTTTSSPAPIASPAPTTLKDSERILILKTLESVGWVIGGPRGAAAKLGLKRTTLIHKMQKLGISRGSQQGARATSEREAQVPNSISRLQ
jgi:transcriptional regulator with GAF, ATPase, and Fis domain